MQYPFFFIVPTLIACSSSVGDSISTQPLVPDVQISSSFPEVRAIQVHASIPKKENKTQEQSKEKSESLQNKFTKDNVILDSKKGEIFVVNDQKKNKESAKKIKIPDEHRVKKKPKYEIKKDERSVNEPQNEAASSQSNKPPAETVAHTPTEIERVVASVEQRYGNVVSLDMDFVQTIENEAFAQEMTQSGSIHIMQPNLFLWDITFPMEQRYYYDGATLKVWNPMTNQLLVSEYRNTEENMASILQNLSSLSKEYRVEIYRQNNTEITLNAIPRTDIGCSNIQLTFSKKSYDVRALESQCADTGSVHIIFSNSRRNTRTDSSIFDWTPPSDAEIISSADLVK
jgi:chaperone LolA